MSPVIQTTHETARTGPHSLDRKALSAPALRTFFRIAELWGLSVDEQMTLLGVTSRSTFFKWKRVQDVMLPKDTLERISYILGIYKALQILLPDERCRCLIRKPNAAPLFGGSCSGGALWSRCDLYVVRQYLDAQRKAGMNIRSISSPGLCWRIIPAVSIELFERVVDPADLEAIMNLSLTNDRLREEVGELQLVPSQTVLLGVEPAILWRPSRI
jgi:hypothetical protein